MSRGAVLMLAAVAALGGLGMARADELSLLNWSSIQQLAPAANGVFPSAPDSWSDLPFQFHVSESVGYNTNITNAPSTYRYNAFQPIGSLESISNYSISFKNSLGANQLYATASAGMYRYLAYQRLNTINEALTVGDTINYSRCSGSLSLSVANAPSQPGQQIGAGVNTTTSVSAAQTGRCQANGNYAVIFNSGATNTKNSPAGGAFNNLYYNDLYTANLNKTTDYQSAFVAAGVEYAVTQTNTFALLATMTGVNYNNRAQVLGAYGLLNKLTTDQVTGTYTKVFGPHLSVSAQIGVVGAVANEFFAGRVPRTILPQYAFNATYAVTPKTSITGSVSRAVTTPNAVVGNLQVTETASLGLTYQWTPKLSLAANAATSYSAGVATPVITQIAYGPYSASQRTFTAGATMAYAFSPFLAASLSYRYYKSLQSVLTTDTSVIMLALNFNPH